MGPIVKIRVRDDVPAAEIVLDVVLPRLVRHAAQEPKAPPVVMAEETTLAAAATSTWRSLLPCRLSDRRLSNAL